MNPYTLIFMLIPFLSLANVDHDYFHPAASAFIHGDTTTASNRVERGLQRYPNEPKLMRLKKLLEQQQQQRNNSPTPKIHHKISKINRKNLILPNNNRIPTIHPNLS